MSPVGKGEPKLLSSPSVMGHFLEGPLWDCRGIRKGKSMGLNIGHQTGMEKGGLIATSGCFLAHCITVLTSTQADMQPVALPICTAKPSQWPCLAREFGGQFCLIQVPNQQGYQL